jgi:acyl-CoA synthetase (AMP-forming)/AMP-acid ligase II
MPYAYTLPDLLRPVSDTGEACALVAPSREPLSYRALHEQTAAIHAALRRRSVDRKDRVALVLPNGAEMAAAMVAVASSAVCAPLNPGYGNEEFRFYFADLQPKALVLAAEDRGPARAVAVELGIRCLDVGWDSHRPAGCLVIDGGGAAPGFDQEPPHPDDLSLVLHTSGTTSRPRLVALSHRNLCASARNIARTLQLAPHDRCLNLMPLFHVHGFIAALLASLGAGGSVACCTGYRDDLFLTWLDALKPTWYTAAPSVHQAILSELAHHPAGAAAQRLRFARSSSATLPSSVLHALESALGAPVIEAYGMTEASHQITSNPLPPAERRTGSVGLAAGPSVAIMGDDQRLLPPGATGEVVIRGDNVTAGYAHPDTGCEGAFAAGWFRTGDLGFLDDAGYLYLAGRLKEIINRGGEKVSPFEVDAALQEHDAVLVAVTFGVQHPTLGEDVAAAVVLKEAASATAEEIRASLFGRLAEFKIPSRVVIVEALPFGATGKIQRRDLAARLSTQLQPSYVAPRDATEQEISSLFCTVLGVPAAGVGDNFFALGGDSLRGSQVLSRIRDCMRVNVSILDLFKAPTVEQLAAVVARNRRESEIAALERGIAEVERLSDEEAFRLVRGDPGR